MRAESRAAQDSVFFNHSSLPPLHSDASEDQNIFFTNLGYNMTGIMASDL